VEIKAYSFFGQKLILIKKTNKKWTFYYWQKELKIFQM
jgi:hypothetical protein